MYITLKSIKRDLGFKGIEIPDILIAFPIIIFFIILFCFTKFKISSLIFLLIGIFCLLPINVSQFVFRKKIFIYYNTERENESNENS